MQGSQNVTFDKIVTGDVQMRPEVASTTSS